MNQHPFTICLWYDTQAEDAAKFYTSIFKDGKIGKISRYGKEGFEFHQKPEGSVMMVSWEANGMKFQGLNGGPNFKFNESFSFVVVCDSQKEIDYFWEKLTDQGGKEVQCGWLTDRFGMSWQIVPKVFMEMMESKTNPQGAHRAMNAMFTMKKFDIAKLQEAFNGH